MTLLTSLCFGAVLVMSANAKGQGAQNSSQEQAEITIWIDDALSLAREYEAQIKTRANADDFKHYEISLKSKTDGSVLTEISTDIAKIVTTRFGQADRHVGQSRFWTDKVTETQIGLWKEGQILSIMIDGRVTEMPVPTPRIEARANGRPVKIKHVLAPQNRPKIAQNRRFMAAD